MRPKAHALRQAVLRDYKLGIKVAEIAAQHGVSIAFISGLARKNGVLRIAHRRPGGPGGHPHPRRAEIVQAYVDGMRPVEIAKMFGCHQKSPRKWALLAGHDIPPRQKSGPNFYRRNAQQLEMFV
jgi:uncharacterized protein YjcR